MGIYGAKTMHSLHRYKFSESFCLSVNEKRFSSRVKATKFLNEIVVPYVKKRESKFLSSNQKALVSFDGFKGRWSSGTSSKESYPRHYRTRQQDKVVSALTSNGKQIRKKDFSETIYWMVHYSNFQATQRLWGFRKHRRKTLVVSLKISTCWVVGDPV